MADQKTSQLTAITNANLSTTDQLMVADISAVESKSITVSEMDNRYKNSIVNTYTATQLLTLDNQIVVGDTVGGTFEITLPDATLNPNVSFRIVKQSGNTDFNKLTVSDGGSFNEFLVGAAESIKVVSNGVGWLIVDWSESEGMDYIPNIPGATNVTTNIIKCTFQKKTININGQVGFNGSGGAATAILFDVPTTLTIDDTRLPGGTNTGNDTASNFGGQSTWFESGVAWRFVQSKYASTTQFGFFMTTQALFLSQLSSGDSVNYVLEIPVA